MRRRVRLLVQAIVLGPLLALVRLLRPWMMIRFGPLESSRVGHFAANTEVYLCERDAGLHGRRTVDFFYHQEPICNEQLGRMWGRTLRVHPVARYLDELNRRVPGGEAHIVSIWETRDRDPMGLFGRTRPHLSFTKEEERRGQAELRKMGIPESAAHVCFHARDSAYLDTVQPGNNWRYHDYRDSDIETYLGAAKALAPRGYYAIRMGAVVVKALRTDNPNIIDYAAGGFRNDFMDVYLSARCSFFICDTAGIYALAAIFRKPIAFVNFVPLEYVLASNPNYLFIPKKIRNRETRHVLTFSEILNSGAGRFLRAEQYRAAGLEVLENSPEEIAALAIEMDQRLKGTWKNEPEDEELQKRFWSLFKPNDLNRIFAARIGTEFLRKNRPLLGQG